ncbi:MAG: hypothetical protein HY360_15670 [Verrucomicrobia bacterium]|nr:hypothetical protein [Verrucomicrobiota bacterium]
MNETKLNSSVVEAYDQWMASHSNELFQRYAGKVVAVYQGKVIEVGDTLQQVYEKVDARHLTVPPLVFEVPTEKDLVSIL